MLGCDCARDRLCDRCTDDAFAQLRGVAACRGEVWAMAIAKTHPRTRPWPCNERTRAIARRKVEDLSADERLATRLATELQYWAARWWGP